MSNETQVTIADKVEGTCRKCGETFIVGFEGEERTPVVLHTSPPCEEFLRRDILDFLQWNRLGDC